MLYEGLANNMRYTVLIHFSHTLECICLHILYRILNLSMFTLLSFKD